MTTEPLTQDEIAKTNAYVASCGPDKYQHKIELIEALKAGPDTFNPMIRSLINTN